MSSLRLLRYCQRRKQLILHTHKPKDEKEYNTERLNILNRLLDEQGLTSVDTPVLDIIARLVVDNTVRCQTVISPKRGFSVDPQGLKVLLDDVPVEMLHQYMLPICQLKGTEMWWYCGNNGKFDLPHSRTVTTEEYRELMIELEPELKT